MVRILSYTKKLVFINTTDENIFINIRADSNPYRGIVVKPGRTNLCICGFTNRRKRLNSKQPLHVRLKPRPTDVMQNVKFKRKINHHDFQETLIILPRILMVSKLKDLASTTIPTIQTSDQLSEYGIYLNVHNNMHFYRIQYWECIRTKYGETSHWWVNINACECIEMINGPRREPNSWRTWPNLYGVHIDPDDTPHRYGNWISLDSDFNYH